MTVYPTSEPDPTDTTKDTDGPGPSGRVITPSGGASFAQYGGFISFEYEGVDLWYAKTRSVNAHLIQQSRGYNHTLALDLSGPEGDRTHPKAFWRIPRSASPGTYRTHLVLTLLQAVADSRGQYRAAGHRDPGRPSLLTWRPLLRAAVPGSSAIHQHLPRLIAIRCIDTSREWERRELRHERETAQ